MTSVLDALRQEWLWSKPWVAAWAFNVASWLAAIPLLSPFRWAIYTATAFFLQEGFALWHGLRNYPVKAERFRAPFPPLTYVTRYYLPRWLTYSVFGAAVGSVGVAMSAGLLLYVRGGVIGGLYAWLIEHFEVTYREMPEPR